MRSETAETKGMQPTDTIDNNHAAIRLTVISIVGYAAVYALNLILATHLSREEFNDYNVGISTLLLLAAIAPLGLEKLALRVVPVYKQKADWRRLRGFLRFAIFAAAAVSIAMSFSFDTILESVLVMQGTDYHIAIPVIVSCLPLLSVFYVLLEIATAFDAPIAAATLYRLAMPVVLLLMTLGVWYSPLGLSGITASWCYLCAWLGVTVAMWWLVKVRLSHESTVANPAYNRAAWLAESTPLLVNGLLLTVISQIGVIALELSPNFHSQASIFAVAMQTGTFVVLFTTSTNRYYLPRIALFLSSRDQNGLAKLRRQRFWLIGGIAVAHVVLVVLFARFVLRLHGTDFEQGYLATTIIASGAAISTTFALSPYALQFAGYHQLVLKSSTLATLLSVVMCVSLANSYGTVGVAAAYALPLSLLYLYLTYEFRRRLQNCVAES